MTPGQALLAFLAGYPYARPLFLGDGEGVTETRETYRNEFKAVDEQHRPAIVRMIHEAFPKFVPSAGEIGILWRGFKNERTEKRVVCPACRGARGKVDFVEDPERPQDMIPVSTMCEACRGNGVVLKCLKCEDAGFVDATPLNAAGKPSIISRQVKPCPDCRPRKTT